MGNIMLGFAVLMTGMQMMSGAVSPLRENQMFINMLTMFSNPLAGILVGILFTAVLQSASATVGVLQALSVTGILTFASTFPIVLGIGVGAACPVLISAIGANKNGKRRRDPFYVYGSGDDTGKHCTFKYRIPSGDCVYSVPVYQ